MIGSNPGNKIQYLLATNPFLVLLLDRVVYQASVPVPDRSRSLPRECFIRDPY